MEGNKLDLTGKNEEKQPLASYKAIPEADMEDEIVASPKTVKVKNNSVADGAEEKMLPDDELKYNSNNVDVSDHKVIITAKNGDAKLDIGEIKSALAGLGKEELMKYANDPFWIRIRWFLFILFWLLWLGMLVASVLIIYSAPKCNPPPAKAWWQEGPLLEIASDTKPEQLQELQNSGIKGLIVEWPEDSYEEINEGNNVIKLLHKSKEINFPVILDLEASMSNIWFGKSENGSGFEDYYIWRPPKKIDAAGTPEPPNNWVSRKNESSWKYSSLKKEYFYAPEGWPQLNFRNAEVVEKFSKVLEKFASKGARGFRIRDAHILLVDPHFEDQPPNNSKDVKEKNYYVRSYGFYIHSMTENLPELGHLLKQWRNVTKSVTSNGPFMIKNPIDKVESYKVFNSLVVDLPSQSQIFSKPEFDAQKVVHGFRYAFETQGFTWPLWMHKSDVLPYDVFDSITYFVPGVPILQTGAKVNKELLTIRNTSPALSGGFSYKTVANNTVLAFTRFAEGSPGILVAVNPNNQTIHVDFEKEVGKISSEVTVQFVSQNFNTSIAAIGSKNVANSFPISPKSSVVLSYTINSED